MNIETKKMQENNLFKDYTMQDIWDEFDLIECFEVPGQQLHVGERRGFVIWRSHIPFSCHVYFSN